MTSEVWLAAVNVEPGRRDREAVLARAVRAGMVGGRPPWPALADPELRRRAGYLLDVAQTLRGQTAAEAADLRDVRAGLGGLGALAFWPGERGLPAGADPVAARWGYTRGCNLARLRAALLGSVPVLPGARDAGAALTPRSAPKATRSSGPASPGPRS